MARAETWGFEAARPDGTGVFVQLIRVPEARLAWYWAYVFLPDVGLTVVRDHEVPLPRPGAPDLEIRADSLWAELVCETPGEHWGIGLEAFGVVLDDPWDALRGELGTRVPVGLDLEWETTAPPWRDSVSGREHQVGRVHGELIVGTERVAFDEVGARDHGEGELAWVPGGHRVAFAIGETVAAEITVGAGGAVAGHVWRLGGGPAPIAGALVETHPGAPAVPSAMRYVLDGSLEVEAEVASVAVIPLAAGTAGGAVPYLLKALTRFTALDNDEERTAAGFAEWIRDVAPLG